MFGNEKVNTSRELCIFESVRQNTYVLHKAKTSCDKIVQNYFKNNKNSKKKFLSKFNLKWENQAGYVFSDEIECP